MIIEMYNITVNSDAQLHNLPELSTLCRPRYTQSKQMTPSLENLHKVVPQGMKQKVKK